MDIITKFLNTLHECLGAFIYVSVYTLLLAFSSVRRTYYNFRSIPYKTSSEGFVYRPKEKNE